MKRVRSRLPRWLAGALIFAVGSAVWAPNLGGIRAELRETALDRLLPLVCAPTSATDGVTIVDIDRAALARLGPWPWSRGTLARLVEAIADGRPAAIGIDILLSGPDRFSRDGDARLAEAMEAVPVVLGFVLDSNGPGEQLPATPVLVRERPNLGRIWRVPGVIGPTPELADAATGFGALAMAADPDGPIRRVPLLVLAGGWARASLAVETVLRARQGSTLMVGPGSRLRIGDIGVPLGTDAQLRLVPSTGHWESHTISAVDLLDHPERRQSLVGQIVLLGGSAPELGGLRITPGARATPTVQLQATAVAAILQGSPPFRPPWADGAELAGVLTLCGAALLFATSLRPVPAAGVTLLLVVGWAAAAAAAAPFAGVLIDPAGPPTLVMLSFAVMALVRYARDEWRARVLRASFEQHLAPEVVRRIAADPSALRLQGEMREVTALFTDIEGFTAMTERAEPTDLVALLDAYFDATTRIIIDHGGMITKIVGDAIHSIFNAPFTVEDHPRCAVASAIALVRAAESMRHTALGQRLQLGRTRVGIETGQAIVGDVGGRRKLDYAAHGNAVNAAARLEAANKMFESSICIGPGTASRLDPTSIRLLGSLVPRGQSREIAVYTPVEI
jgi:adenylate cyclase